MGNSLWLVRVVNAQILDRNNVIQHLAKVDDMAQGISTMIPMQVLSDIDSARNPMQLTRERLERAATENHFMNGKIAAIDVSVYLYEPDDRMGSKRRGQSYRRLLDEALCQNFPELEPHFHEVRVEQ